MANTIEKPRVFLRKNKEKKKYLAALALFLAAMYLMVFVERYFENNGIANVDTCSLERSELEHWIEGTGVVTGAKIKAHFVPAGKMLQKGDLMYVKVAGTDRIELPIAHLSYDAKENIMTAYFKIGKATYEEGAQVIVSKQQKTRKYTCIAADAVHKDAMGNQYVYLVKEKKSILGNERVCKMKYIKVFLEDGNYAAIDLGKRAITDSDLIVLHSDREVTEGSRVHLLE